MFKVWISRGIFIFLILLCLGGWLRSFWYTDGFLYYSGKSDGFCAASFSGSLDLSLLSWKKNPDPKVIDIPFDWGFQHIPASPGDQHILLMGEHSGTHYFCGFGYSNDLGGSIHHRDFVVPYYFFILFFSLALFFVWRKTRRWNLKAFPVVVKQGTAAS